MLVPEMRRFRHCRMDMPSRVIGGQLPVRPGVSKPETQPGSLGCNGGRGSLRHSNLVEHVRCRG